VPDLDAAGVPHVGLYRRGTAAALVLGPALFLADNLLHPKEYARGNEVEQAAEIADAYARWQLAHALGFVSIVVFLAVVLGLAFLVRRRQPGLGLVGGGLGAIGLVGLGAAITIDGFAWGIAGEVSAKGALSPGAVAVLHDLQHSEWSLLYYGTTLAFVVGVVILSLSAARQGAVPWWAAGLLALAAAMVGAEGALISNAYFVASAAVLLAGGAAVALTLARMSDDEFAAGGGGRAGRPA
jgi:hypothetical protein